MMNPVNPDNIKNIRFTICGIVTVLLFLFLVSSAEAANRYSVATGTWASTSTWSSTSGGAGGAAVPTASDNVYIEGGYTVTISATGATCASLTVGTSTAGTLSLNGGSTAYTLTVAGNVSVASNGIFQDVNITGLYLFSLSIGGNLTVAGTFNMVSTYDDRCDVTFTGSAPTIGGGGTIIFHNLTFSNTGTASVTSDISLISNPNGTIVQGILTVPAGWTLNLNSSTLTLTSTSCSPLSVSGTFNAGTGTVNFNGSDVQTVAGVTYYNLTLSGAGAKTTTGVTVNNILDMAGTATASIAPTYGSNATLQYDQTVTAGPEWITPFTATGGVIINSGTVTLGVAKVFGSNTNVPLTINSGATLTPGAYLLTFDGDFNNAGTLTSGSGGVTITGTTGTQSIDGFTTTGNVSCTKTAGTATIIAVGELGAVSAVNLSVSGAGGTLNLSGSNTFSGTRTLSAGTLILANTAALGAAATALTISGGTLDLANNTGVNAYNITVSGSAQIISDVSSGTSGITYTLGTLSIGNQTLTIAGGTNVNSGTAGVTFGSVTHTAAPTYTVTDPTGGGATQLSLGAVSNSTYLTTFNGSGDIVQTGVFGSGSGGITYSGTGSLTLNQANTFTGILTVSGGTVIGTSVAGALGASTAAGAVTLSGGTLKLTNTSGSNLSFSRNTTVSTSSTIISDVTSGAGNTYTLGTLSIGNQTLTIAGGSNVSSGTAGVTFGSVTHTAAPTYTVNNPTGGGVTQLSLGAVSNSTYLTTFNGSGNIVQTGVFGSGSGGITYSGTGSLTLNQANTFTGILTVSSGTVVGTSVVGALGASTAAGAVTLSGGTLKLTNTSGSNLSFSRNTTVNSNSQITTDVTAAGAGDIFTLGTLSIGNQTLTIAGGSNVNSGTAGVTFGSVTHTAAPTYTVTAPAGGGTTRLSLGAVSNSTYLTTFNGNGDVIQSGVFGSGSGGITYSGTGSLTLSQANTFTGGVTLNSGTLNINNNQALGTSAGTFTIAGGTINATSSGISTVAYPLALNADFTFTGTYSLNLGTGTITPNASRQVTVSANTLTLGGTFNAGTLNLTKAGGGTLSYGSQTITLNNVTISGGTFISTSGTMNIAGNFTNNGTFTHNSGTVVFNGSSGAQTISGSSTTFNNLTINNSSGVTFSSVDATVNSTLLFTSGKITTGSNKVIVGIAGTGGTITGAAAGQYVNGNLRRFIPATLNYSAYFYIGDASNYTPVIILFAGTPGGSSSLDASTTVGAPPVASGLSQSKYINRKWTVTNNGVTGFTSYSPTLTFVDGDKIGSPNTNAVVIRKLDGSTWSVTTTGTQTSNTTQCTGLTSFSEFDIGEQGNDHFVFTLASPQTNGSAFTGTNTLTAQDVLNQTITAFDASTNNVTITANSPLTGAISGLSGTNKLTSAGDFSSGVANLTTLGMIYTGNAATGTFTATSADSKTGTSGSVQINAGAATHLVITGSSSQTAGNTQNLTITAKDGNDNTALTYTGSKNLIFSGANSSTNPVTAPTVKNSSGSAIAFGSTTAITFTSGVATVSSGNNGAMALYKAEVQRSA